MSERYETGGRELDEEFNPVVFESESDNSIAVIEQLTEDFFEKTKQSIGLSELAVRAAEEAGEWRETITIVPLNQPGKKPVRLVRELWYYEELAVASVVQDFRRNGTIAVSFSRHKLSPEQRDRAFRVVEQLEGIITREAF